MIEEINNPEELNPDDLQDISDKIINDEKAIFGFYDKLRKKIGDKIPSGKNHNSLEIKDLLFFLPDFFMLLTRVLVDQRVKRSHKVMLSCILGYLIIPFDILPDFIPILGYVDDFVILILGIDVLLSDIDKNILLDNWSGKANLLDIVKASKDKIEQNIQTPFLRNLKTLLKTFGSKNDRNSDSDKK
jgi:uncharacterized membrane protein YkvA (DUF1232 family)